MAYILHNFLNNTAPPVSAENLNEMDEGIYNVDAMANDTVDTLYLATNYAKISPSGDGYIDTGKNVGQTVDTSTTTSPTVWENYIIPCTSGDKFTLKKIQGGTAPRAWCFTDSTYKVISVAASSQSVQSDILLTAPTNAAFLILNNYKYNTTAEIYKGENLNKQIGSLSSALDKYFVSYNLLYGQTKVSGYYKNANGIAVADANYCYYSFPVKNGKTYTISPRGRFVYIEDAGGSKIYGDSANTITSFTSPGNGTAFVTFYSNQSDYKVYDSSITGLINDLDKILLDTKNVQIDISSEVANITAQNPLYRKKWAVCGDSFTAGVTGTILDSGKYAGNQLNYAYLIANRNDMTIYNFFASGRTLAYPSDGTFHNSLTASAQTYYYQNIPADADYITVYLGINDGNHYAGWSPDGESTQGFIDLGTIDDNTTASYYGAWNVVLSWLIQNRPFAHIGILVSNGCLNNDWREAQINIAKKYGVPYIDLNGDRFTPVMIRSQNPDISSTVKDYVKAKQAVNPSTNTHPNDNAHIYESYFIEDFLRTI